jgi:EamA-like transporter family
MNFESWQVWAVLSAVFAALTAIFAKIGVENINSDLATFIRTVVVLFSFLVLLLVTGQFVRPEQISARTWTFLILSGLATGASWLCYFRASNWARHRWSRRSTSSAWCWSRSLACWFSVSGRRRSDGSESRSSAAVPRSSHLGPRKHHPALSKEYLDELDVRLGRLSY